MKSLKQITKPLSQSHIRSIPVYELLDDEKKMVHIRQLFPKWWYTSVLDIIATNDLNVATPNWFLEYIMSTTIGFDKRFIDQRQRVLYEFLLQRKKREFQFIGLLKNINKDCFYNDNCLYNNNDLLFAVQYNESLILFLLFTPLVQNVTDYIYTNMSRVFDKEFQVKTFCKWFEEDKLGLVNMFLVEQFYFEEE